MNNFKKSVYRTSIESTVPVCKAIVSFDYTGVGNILFRYKLCGDTFYTTHDFTGLPNSGGIYFTYIINDDPSFESGLCVEDGTFEYVPGGSIINSDNYIYSISSCS